MCCSFLYTAILMGSRVTEWRGTALNGAMAFWCLPRYRVRSRILTSTLYLVLSKNSALPSMWFGIRSGSSNTDAAFLLNVRFRLIVSACQNVTSKSLHCIRRAWPQWSDWLIRWLVFFDLQALLVCLDNISTSFSEKPSRTQSSNLGENARRPGRVMHE